MEANLGAHRLSESAAHYMDEIMPDIRQTFMKVLSLLDSQNVAEAKSRAEKALKLANEIETTRDVFSETDNKLVTQFKQLITSSAEEAIDVIDSGDPLSAYQIVEQAVQDTMMAQGSAYDWNLLKEWPIT